MSMARLHVAVESPRDISRAGAAPGPLPEDSDMPQAGQATPDLAPEKQRKSEKKRDSKGRTHDERARQRKRRAERFFAQLRGLNLSTRRLELGDVRARLHAGGSAGHHCRHEAGLCRSLLLPEKVLQEPIP